MSNNNKYISKLSVVSTVTVVVRKGKLPIRRKSKIFIFEQKSNIILFLSTTDYHYIIG